MSELTRRHFCVLTGAGLVGAACGSGSSGSDGGGGGGGGGVGWIRFSSPGLSNSGIVTPAPVTN
jgi:hypothetical protein